MGGAGNSNLSLTACGSDENENVIQSKEKTAKLELTLVGTPADSRVRGLCLPRMNPRSTA
jgi:hypothetical protein